MSFTPVQLASELHKDPAALDYAPYVTSGADGTLVQQIYAANLDALYQADVANGYGSQDPNNPDPNLLFPGTELTLPGGDTTDATG